MLQKTNSDGIEIFEDRVYLSILALTYRRPYSAEELANKLKLSPPVIYRRLKVLKSYGYVKVVKSVLSRNGRRVNLYGSKINSISLTLDGGNAKIKVFFEIGVSQERVVTMNLISESR